MKSKHQEKEYKVSGLGYRHQQCLALLVCLTVAYTIRTCIGVAMVAMTVKNYNDLDKQNTNTTLLNNTTTEEEQFQSHGVLNALMLAPPYPKFKWNKKIQDTIMSSFFWGYVVTQIPAGQLAHKFGAKYLLTGAMFVNSLVSILSPLAAYYGGWITIMLCRVVQGLSQACVLPGMHTVFGKWTPLEERGRLTAVAYGGTALGAVLGLPITGFIASSPMGWPGIFYFYGLLSGISGIIIWIWVADSPALHPKISEAERRYIEEGLGQSEKNEEKKSSIPWLKILSHPGMYAIMVAHIGQAWGVVTLFSEIPSFMDKVMEVDIGANGLLSALPFLAMWLANFFFCWFSDMLVVKKYLSVCHARKLLNSIGTVIPAIGLVILAFVPKNIYVVEIILVIICTFKVAAQSGFQVNHIDISPNFAGMMMSFSNFASNVMSSLSPILAGFILTDITREYLWRQVFLVAAGFYFCSDLVYVILGTADRAEWNEPPQEKICKENKEESQPMLIEKKQNV